MEKYLKKKVYPYIGTFTLISKKADPKKVKQMETSQIAKQGDHHEPLKAL